METRKLHCWGRIVVQASPLMVQPHAMGLWLVTQRCRKGPDVKQLEEAMGQALLALPLKKQYELFMEWFRCFSKRGIECPNLSKAFQVWWRRTSFLRGSASHAIQTM
ncbi:hypothetical protein Ancab_000489 [Ancistrocladus abbreviatus]